VPPRVVQLWSIGAAFAAPFVPLSFISIGDAMNLRHLPLVLAVVAALVLGLTLMNRAQPVQHAAGPGPFSMIEAGAQVTVFLRGDASGVAFSDRSADGFLIGREGKVISVDDKWIVLENKGRRSFLPLDAVAVLDVTAPAK
jgi:hypothetical protein